MQLRFWSEIISGVIIIGVLCLGYEVSYAEYRNSKPNEACQFMSSAKLATGGYKTIEGMNEYYCVSEPKKVSDGHPLPNTIGYHVTGDASTAKRVYLVLNVNQNNQKKTAYLSLLKDSELLTKKALNANLPHAVMKSITSGKSGTWKLKNTSIKVRRENWPTGKGHEIKFIIE
ncbi:MAG: hypothetical protein PHG20_07575 [Geobacteraceae bacterium]|nr:hypothetical protein [Geobacteraceae bacterium]